MHGHTELVSVVSAFDGLLGKKEVLGLSYIYCKEPNKTTHLPQMHVVVTAWEIKSHTIPRRYIYNNSITFNNDVIGMN